MEEEEEEGEMEKEREMEGKGGLEKNLRGFRREVDEGC